MDIIVIETAGVKFSQLEKYLGCVSKARQTSVMKKQAEEQRIQSLVAGLLVRSELSRRTGIPTEKLLFDRGTHGKPYIKGSEVRFSLSHTSGAVCAAFAEGAGDIGVDIERRDRKVSMRLKTRTLSQNEAPLVCGNEDFIRIWVKKEAFLKRAGIGIATELCGADTTLLPDIHTLEAGEYLVGAAGKTSAEARLIVMQLSELLKRFD